MPVVSSGQIRLNADVNVEINGSTGADVSLSSLSTGAGFSAPHGLTEFYGYTSMSAPSVTTNAISGVTVTNMTLNGNVTSDGGGTVTSRGFYFGTSSNVTSNPQYASGSGTGAFSLNRSVSASTTYYCAAYATNAAGTTVGSTVSATSQAAVPVGTYTSGTVTFRGHKGASLSNQVVSASYYWQYNHPNYGYTNIATGSTYQYGSSFGSGLTSGTHNVSGTYKRRTDTNQVLGHRTYISANLQSISPGGNANFLGSGDPGYMSGGCHYGAGGNYSNTSSQSWANYGGSLAGSTYTNGGGQVYWTFTGCCYNFNANGFADRRR